MVDRALIGNEDLEGSVCHREKSKRVQEVQKVYVSAEYTGAGALMALLDRHAALHSLGGVRTHIRGLTQQGLFLSSIVLVFLKLIISL